MKSLLTTIILVTFMVACNPPEKLKGDSLLVLENVNLIDGTGQPIIPNSVVVVEDDKIIRVGAGIQAIRVQGVLLSTFFPG